MTNLLFFSIDEIGRNDVITFSRSLAQGINLNGSDNEKFKAMSFKLRDDFKTEEKKEERAALAVNDLFKVPNFARKGKNKSPTLPVVISGEEHCGDCEKKQLEKAREETDKLVSPKVSHRGEQEEGG